MKDEYSVGIGTPTLSLLPARNYYYKVLVDQHKVVIPRKGNYCDLVEEDNKDMFDGESEFNIYDSENDVMYLATITKVLFATKQYPDLPQNHLFVPSVLVFSEEEVTIVGQIVEMLSKEQYNKELGNG